MNEEVMSSLLPYLIDVPVRINIWIRPECQRKQFEIIKQARPSTIFLQSDGGRSASEWNAIEQNRALYENGINWECEVHKLYEKSNLGLYTMGAKVMSYIWEHVDRCIFLEDDHIPSVSFFRFCAELLEKYRDDERIEMICGNNVLEHYPDPEPNDYFFTQVGWSISGTALWRSRTEGWNFPLDYAEDEYIKKRLLENLTPFWYKKAKGYFAGKLHENHVPGGEFFRAANSALYHRLSIVPTKNMISNIGIVGENVNTEKRSFLKPPAVFNLKAFDIDFPIKHPRYVIDDISFGKQYEKLLRHDIKTIRHYFRMILVVFDALYHRRIGAEIRKRMKRKT